MKNLILLSLPAFLSVANAQSLEPLPPQWKKWENGGSYDIGKDVSKYPFVLTIKQKAKPIEKKIGKGGFCQTIKANNYIGKRIQYSAYIKVKNITNWAYIYADSGEIYPFKGIKGNVEKPVTKDWSNISMTFDIPMNHDAENIRLCFSLWGDGQMWIDGVKWEIAGGEKPPITTQSIIPLEPVL